MISWWLLVYFHEMISESIEHVLEARVIWFESYLNKFCRVGELVWASGHVIVGIGLGFIS